MITVGLLGEDPYDKVSIINLLAPKYKHIKFVPLLKNVKGHQLDNVNKVSRMLSFELSRVKYHTIVYIRDLDGLKTEKSKVNERNSWYQNLSRNTASKKILLLNIYELEALILADIETFNSIFKSKIKYAKDPMAMNKPKEFLKSETKKGQRTYAESDCPEIFNRLNFDLVYNKCAYFKEFIKDFDNLVKKN